MTYSIDQYDPSIFAAGGDQPVVHLYAVSGNEYVAQYDVDAGYFFTDQILKTVDTATLAVEIPGRIYEPLKGFDFYRNPGTPVTIREILNSQSLSTDNDPAYEVAEILSREGFSTSPYGVGKVEGLMKSIKVDVSYDGRRGAQVAVFYYNQRPFMVTSNAGRELDDVQRTWILDESTTRQVAEELMEKPELQVTDIDQVVNLAYWEGCPVQLGDNFYGLERPADGRGSR